MLTANDLPTIRLADVWPPPPRTTMPGHFCTVEPIDPERHAAQLFASYLEDGAGVMWAYALRLPFASFEEVRSWAIAASQRTNQIVYAILGTTTGEAIGNAAFGPIDQNNGVIEISGVTYSPRLQRRSAGTEAMYLMMRRVFDELGYRRCQWRTDSLNARSCSAALRFGFRQDGLFRQAQVIRGRNVDLAWFSVIDSEWPALRAAFERWLDPANFDVQGQQRQSLGSLRGDA